MKIVEQHVSPDGLLRLVVTRDDGGDLSVGFDTGCWHTHGDILASLSGLSETDAVRQLVEQITGDEQILALSRVGGEVRDVWPCDDPPRELRYQAPDESLEFRRWSGAAVDVSTSD